MSSKIRPKIGEPYKLEEPADDLEENILAVQANLALTYSNLGRREEALCIERDVYSGSLKLFGKEHERTVIAANNYASSLSYLNRFEEAKALLRKTLPVARRVLGESHELTFRMRWIYGRALSDDPNATLDDLREAVMTLDDAGRTARRVLGGSHPLTVSIKLRLRDARAVLAARETPSAS